MSGNKSLVKAKESKQDEFYTRLEDIENEFGQQFMYKLLNCLDECAEYDNTYDDYDRTYDDYDSTYDSTYNDYVGENLYEIYETIIEANKDDEEFMNEFYDVKEFLDNKYGEHKVLKKYSRK